MTESSDLENGLRAVLRELEPYLSDLVLIGGWVPYLYHHYGRFGGWSGRDTLTRELDLLVDQPLHSAGRRPLAALLLEARFRVEAPAVWVRDLAVGEKIEFLTTFHGTARGKGYPVALEGQPGLSAIPLPGLELLRDHTEILHLPEGGGGSPGLSVRVPTLGAYVINKAATFMSRGNREDEDGHPKLAKDLLYLRDVAAAGHDVVEEIESSVERLARASSAHAEMVRTAANHLGLVVGGGSPAFLRAVARMVAERDGSADLEHARARTVGYLTDLHEILADAARKHTDDA